MALTVDLNSDLAEGYGTYTCGDDAAMLALVTSANVACGFHAGDYNIMANAFAIAKDKGVAVGAHPGYPDLHGFGRRVIPFPAKDIENFIAYQIGAAVALAAKAGTRITYVKTHGALGNLAAANEEVAGAVARAVKGVDPSLGFLSQVLSVQTRVAQDIGLTVYNEIFADRGYQEDGQLIPRGQPGAMITDADAAATRILTMLKEGAIITGSGKLLKTPIDSICVHGDSAHAVAMAQALKQTLIAEGVTLKAFAPA